MFAMIYCYYSYYMLWYLKCILHIKTEPQNKTKKSSIVLYLPEQSIHQLDNIDIFRLFKIFTILERAMRITTQWVIIAYIKTEKSAGA
jgi:hypothetical protein